ncbi:conserved hypothetical protein [Acinetobacter proteolyticus]|jgi:hypothetical protein|uniref:Uncharacterized protein n=1 Tax=Acinetobacter proteolyticus TaxID=1776741 RepID=A0A653KBP0_9GAMM|nr:hypothetical protein [Acinetobacter proteolyticus]VXA58353.1 conserved hypothetical protein [Acinetobacter proteolyticus]
MELNLENFPTVEITHQHQGSLIDFIEQLDQLLQKQKAFVLVRHFQSKFNEPSPAQEQWKQAIQWIKAHTQALSIVKGWIEITEMEIEESDLLRDQKVWKIPFYKTDSFDEALHMSKSLLSVSVGCRATI